MFCTVTKCITQLRHSATTGRQPADKNPCRDEVDSATSGPLLAHATLGKDL